MDTTPPTVTDNGISDEDRELLNRFYAASMSEGGSTDEVILRGLKAVMKPRYGSMSCVKL